MFDITAFKLAQLFRKIKRKSPPSVILSNAFPERPDEKTSRLFLSAEKYPAAVRGKMDRQVIICKKRQKTA